MGCRPNGKLALHLIGGSRSAIHSFADMRAAATLHLSHSTWTGLGLSSRLCQNRRACKHFAAILNGCAGTRARCYGVAPRLRSLSAVHWVSFPSSVSGCCRWVFSSFPTTSLGCGDGGASRRYDGTLVGSAKGATSKRLRLVSPLRTSHPWRRAGGGGLRRSDRGNLCWR